MLAPSLREKYVFLLLEDPNIAVNSDIEQHLWKNVFYKCIEGYRKELRGAMQSKQRTEETRHITSEFTSFLDSATLFYEDLLKKYSARHDLVLTEPHSAESDTQKQYFTAFRFQICLGDIGSICSSHMSMAPAHEFEIQFATGATFRP
jgi:hypothetical protein